MRIRRFNEAKDPDGDKWKWYPEYIREEGKVWILKDDLQYFFSEMLGTKNVVIKNDNEKQIRDSVFKIFQTITDRIDDIGGNSNKIHDPYDEEHWND